MDDPESDGDSLYPGALPTKEYEHSEPGTQEIPVSPKRTHYQQEEPSLVIGYHVHPTQRRIRLPRRHYRLVFEKSALLETLDHPGYAVLRRMP